MTYDGVKTESNNGTRKNTRRYVIICNSDYVRVNGLYNDSNKEKIIRQRNEENIIKFVQDFGVEGIDKAKLLSGLANEWFSGMGDCLQMECTKSYGAEYIVTRNVSDYSVPDIKARFIYQSTTILRNLRQRVQVFALFW